MRHGLIRWDEGRLSRADVESRQARMCRALAEAKLDALLLYTNHVRSGAVTWLSGFTPYWSDGLMLLPREGAPVFSTALSKRVGRWIAATNPTAEVMHSPRPGEVLGRRLAESGAARLGVLELDRLPNGLVGEIAAAGAVELVDATELFRAVRSVPDASELRLVRGADEIARAAFAAAPGDAATVGEVAEALELAVRLAGAEECYVASAPDLAADLRFARRKGDVPLGPLFAVRLSVAWHGAWTRRIETVARGRAEAELRAARDWADAVAREVAAGPGIGAALASRPLPEAMRLADWLLEAPMGTRPLQVVADGGRDPRYALAYGVLTLRLDGRGGPIVLARPVGSDPAARAEAV